jgi:CDP-glucose 4,6-dehydratase
MSSSSFWAGKRVFVTGHTGFKGAWTCLWLQSMGAKVCGYALAPNTEPNLYTIARVGAGMESCIGDVRDLDAVHSAMSRFEPEIVLHLAAQALVRDSYDDPVGTYATNVMGTVHVLEAIRRVSSVRAAVVVTSDKCYENREWVWGYRENEAMGGYDPYSSSKGCAELVTAAYRRSFDAGGSAAIASARAGNVIGGGDWAKDRLVPDIMRALAAGEPVALRNPQAIRPWQHVLEPLHGYILLAERLWHDKRCYAEGWNFGPEDSDSRPVSWIADALVQSWGGGSWMLSPGEHPHEARSLKLDISKAKSKLGWAPRWDLATALERIVEWYRGFHAGQDMRALTLAQIAAYAAAGNTINRKEQQ